jgi:predicted SnoaL-like aldol condensation-catalyzing enzyme
MGSILARSTRKCLTGLQGEAKTKGEAMKRIYVLIPSMVFLLAGAFVSAQPSEETKRIEAVRTLLKAFENEHQTALDVISPKQCTQHNARVADGREGFTVLLNGVSSGTTLRIVRIFADGDYVVAQSEYNLSGRKVAFDVFRFEGCQIVEHWDNMQDECPAPNVSGRTQLDGPTRVVDLDKTEANKAVKRGYFRDVVFGGQRDKVAQYKSPDHFHQHNCNGEDNKSGFQTKTAVFAKPGFVFKYDKLYKVLGQGSFVLMMSEGLFDGKPTAFYDLYRLEEGKQVEHWVALETIPPPAEWENSNGKL